MSAEPAGGIPRLRPVPLQELRLRADALHWSVDQKLAELDSLTPVRGQIRVRHHGGVLEVEGEAETIVTLCCDRCLQHYNRSLRAAVHELLELAGPEAAELEGSDLTALAASAAAAGASGRRSRDTGSGSGACGPGAPGRRAAGRPPAAGRDGGSRDAAARSGLSASQSPGPGNTPSSGSQPRRGPRSRSQPEPLLIEALDDRLDPRGAFDPERWLFEQLSLQLPVVNRCGADCPGPPLAPAAASTASQASGSDGDRSRASQVREHPDPTNGAAGSVHPSSATQPSATHPSATGPAATEPSGAGTPEAPIDPRWAALRQFLP